MTSSHVEEVVVSQESSGSRKGIKLFGVLMEPCKKRGLEINNEAVNRKKKRVRVNPDFQHQPMLPMRYRDLFRSLSGGLEIQEEVLVIQKNLTATDVGRGHNRLSIPLKKMVNEFLCEIDRDYLKMRSQNGKHVNRLKMRLIDVNGTEREVDFRRWEMKKNKKKKPKASAKDSNNKECTKISVMYVINGAWSKIVSENQLKEGDEVQLWAVRGHRRLWWFALVRIPKA